MIGKRGKFSLSHFHITSFNTAQLIPVALLDILPGDSVQMATSALMRFTPLVTPSFHPMMVKIHHWFVPNRMIWDDWDEFISGYDKDGAASTKTYPTATLTTPGIGSLAHYLGVPCDGANNRTVSALPFRAFAKIYNEYYRDQNLQSSLTIDTTDGTDSTTYGVGSEAPKAINWSKDYFTTCSTNEQQSTSGITLPLSSKAYVKGIGKRTNVYAGGAITVYESGESSTSSWGANDNANIQSGAGIDSTFDVKEDGTSGYPDIYADIDGVNADINQLRNAFAQQQFEENRARYGSRIQEYVRMAFPGVVQNQLYSAPLYLGGGRGYMSVSEVLQTGVTTDTTAKTGVGELAGHGIGALRSNRFRRFFTEHGWIMTLASVMPRNLYTEGLHRQWNKTTKYDHYQRELAHTGMQSVLKKELYYDTATPATDIFGYQDRYQEYRQGGSLNRISGQCVTAANNYGKMHSARILGAEPTLNSAFITGSQDGRVFQSTANDTIGARFDHSIQMRRMVSRTGTPGMRKL